MRIFRPILPLLFLGIHFHLHAQSINEKKFAERVSQVRLLATVRDLVSFGNRMGGTASGDQAAQYILTRFKSFGLDAELVEEPEGLRFDDVSWTLKVTQPRRLRALIKNEWLAGFSPSVEKTKATLVYWMDEDMIEDSVRGKIVLTERFVSPRLYEKVTNMGAVCILSYAPNLPNAYATFAMITNLKNSLKNPIPLYNISRTNGERLKAEVAKGIVELEFSAKSEIEERSAKTVIATLQGTSDSYYIVCAHGDSDAGGPGADDNASGVSGVLEIARTLSSLVRSGSFTKPNHSIKFVVWGSEYSSAEHYLRTNRADLDKIMGVMNFDEIGTGATRNCIYFESNDVPHNEKLLRTFHRVGEDYVGKRGFWSESTTNPSQGGTDSYVFLPEYLNRLGLPQVKIPSTTIYTAAWNELRTIPQTEGWSARSWKGHPDSVTVDYSAYYHSSLDVPALTTEKEPFNMAWGVKAVGIALLRLAWENDPRP